MSNIYRNITWLFIDKVFKILFSFVVIAVMARYLGAEKFGLFNYVITIGWFFLAVTSLGFSGTIVKELTANDFGKSTILTTSFLVQLVFSSVVYALVYFICSILSFEINSYLLIYLFTIIFKSSDIARYYLEYKLEMKKAVIIDNCVLFFSSILKLYFVYIKLDLMAFIILIIIEYLLTAIFLMLLLRRTVELSLQFFDSKLAIKLIKDGYPLIISSLSIAILMKVDTLMIEHYLGFESVGLYSSATKLSEFWFFIPAIIAQSFGTKIYELKKCNKHSQLVQELLNYCFVFSFYIAGVISFLSPYIISIVYGEGYSSASMVLSIHIWSGCFVFISIISGRWLLAENLQKKAMKRTIIGVIVNVIANMILIPSYGLNGAAIGTLLGFVCGNYLANAFDSKTRKLFFIQTNAMLFLFKPKKYLEVLSVIRKF